VRYGAAKTSRDDWATPRHVARAFVEEYHLGLDVCATAGNAVTEAFFSPEEDGLKRSWSYKKVWCNPPYSEKKQWIEKALHEVGERGCTRAVLLLPASPASRWFSSILLSGLCRAVVFIVPRVLFVDPTGEGRRSPNHGSCALVLERGLHRPALGLLDTSGGEARWVWKA